MANNIYYKKANVDASQLIELFPENITSSTIMNQTYHDGDGSDNDKTNSCVTGTSTLTVSESQLTSSGKYKNKGSKIGYLAPTKAGSLGSGEENPLLNKYYANGTTVDTSAIGCRPIGIQLKRVETPGTYYIYRSGGITYWSTSDRSGGTALSADYNPHYIVVELQGAGGGGGASNLGAGGQGGCGGAYIACGIYIEENSSIKIVIGAGGARGERENDGKTGDNTTLTATVNGTTFTLIASGGHYGSKATGDNRDYSDTPVDVSQAPANSNKFILLSSHNGCPSSGKDKNLGLGAQITWNYPKAEAQTISRGKFRTGYSGSWNGIGGGWGGGGGASFFHDGGYPDRGTNGTPGTWGSGGSAGSYKAANKNPGGRGGDGLCIVYY